MTQKQFDLELKLGFFFAKETRFKPSLNGPILGSAQNRKPEKKKT